LKRFDSLYGEWFPVVENMVRSGIRTSAGVLAGLELVDSDGSRRMLRPRSEYKREATVPAGVDAGTVLKEPVLVRLYMPPPVLLDQLRSYYRKRYLPDRQARGDEIVPVTMGYRSYLRQRQTAKSRRGKVSLPAELLEGRGKGKAVTYEGSGSNFVLFEQDKLVFPKRMVPAEDQMRAFQPFGGKRRGDRHFWDVYSAGKAGKTLLELSQTKGPLVTKEVAKRLFACGMVQRKSTYIIEAEEEGKEEKERSYTAVVGPNDPVAPGDRLYVWQPEKGASPFFSWVPTTVPVPKGLFDPCLSSEDEAVRSRMNEVVKSLNQFKNALIGYEGDRGIRGVVRDLARGEVKTKEQLDIDKKLLRLGKALQRIDNERLTIETMMDEGSPSEREVAIRCARFLGWQPSGKSPPPLALFRLGVERYPVPEDKSLLAKALEYARSIGLMKAIIEGKKGASSPLGLRALGPALRFLEPAEYDPLIEGAREGWVELAGTQAVPLVHPLYGVYQIAQAGTNNFSGWVVAVRDTYGFDSPDPSREERAVARLPRYTIARVLEVKGSWLRVQPPTGAPFWVAARDAGEAGGVDARGQWKPGMVSSLLAGDVRSMRDRNVEPGSFDWAAGKVDSSQAARARRAAWLFGRLVYNFVGGPNAAPLALPESEDAPERVPVSFEDRERLALVATLLGETLAQRRAYAPDEETGVDDDLRKLLILANVYYGVQGRVLAGPLLLGREQEKKQERDGRGVLLGRATVLLLKSVETYLQSALRTLESGFAIYKTYNPVLFEMTRLYWPTRHGSDPRWQGFLANGKMLQDVDRVGRYGYFAQLMQEYIPDTQDDDQLGVMLWDSTVGWVEFYTYVWGPRVVEGEDEASYARGTMHRVLFPPRNLAQILARRASARLQAQIDEEFGEYDVDIFDPEAVAEVIPLIRSALRLFNGLWPLGLPLGEAWEYVSDLLATEDANGEEFVGHPTRGLQKLKAKAIAAFPRLLSVRQAGLPTKRKKGEPMGLGSLPWVRKLFLGEAAALDPGTKPHNLTEEEADALPFLRAALHKYAQQQGKKIELYPRDTDATLQDFGIDPSKRIATEKKWLLQLQKIPGRVRRRTGEDIERVPLAEVMSGYQPGDVRGLLEKSAAKLTASGLYDAPTVRALLIVEAATVQPPGDREYEGVSNTPWLLRQRTGRQTGRSDLQADIWPESALAQAKMTGGEAVGWVRRLDKLIERFDAKLFAPDET
jgi:hypothetical protein